MIGPSPLSSRKGASQRGAGEAGFTLIETVAAMAILGLLLAVVVPSIPLGVSRPQIEGLALEVAAVLKGDHRAAMERHAPVASIVDTRHRTVRSGVAGRTVTLPDGITVTSLLARSCLGTPATDRIVFLPDGTSCGGTVALARGGQIVDVRVNWLTGATDIASGSP